MLKFFTSLRHLQLIAWVMFFSLTAMSQNEISIDRDYYKIKHGVTFYDKVDNQLNAQLAEEFLLNSMRHYLRLVEIGVLKIDGKNIEDQFNKIAKIKVQFFNEVRFEIKDGLGNYRGSAFWDKEANTIFVAHKHWLTFSDSMKEDIAFHEVQALLGFDDSKFNLSALMATLRDYQKISKIRAKENKTFGQKTVHFLSDYFKKPVLLVAGGGSVTGVGGGGDARPLIFKTALLSHIFYLYEYNEITFAQTRLIVLFIQNLNIEFSNLIQQGDFSVDPLTNTLLIANNPFTAANKDDSWKAVEEFSQMIIKETKARDPNEKSGDGN